MYLFVSVLVNVLLVGYEVLKPLYPPSFYGHLLQEIPDGSNDTVVYDIEKMDKAIKDMQSTISSLKTQVSAGTHLHFISIPKYVCIFSRSFTQPIVPNVKFTLV
jgi:hypothetical protein